MLESIHVLLVLLSICSGGRGRARESCSAGDTHVLGFVFFVANVARAHAVAAALSEKEDAFSSSVQVTGTQVC